MKQITLWDEPVSWLNDFEARLRQLRLHRLFFWTATLRDIFTDLTTRRHAAYEQLMLCEAAVERGDRAAALDRLASAKGLLALLMLALVLHGLLTGSDDAMRRPRGGSAVKVVRQARRREGDLAPTFEA